jgi:lipid A ethanolaminephosphotransferase
LIWLMFYNVEFWKQAAAAMWQPEAKAGLFAVSLFTVVWALQAALMVLLPSRLLMRTAASALFIIAALSSYFTSAYGAIMDKDMIRNALQTDPAEVGGLLNTNLIAHIVFMGVIPALLVWRVTLPAAKASTLLKRRALGIVTVLAVVAVSLFACSADYAVFFREHKPVRFALSPTAPVVGLAGILSSGRGKTSPEKLLTPAGVTERLVPARAKPMLLLLVVGETARAASFQLDGYSRPTNPHLAATENFVYFRQVASCGTSTAISLPCLFSHLGRTQFAVDEASHYENLLDSLVQAGFAVEWLDNNAGCKGVCARVNQTKYSRQSNPRLCTQSHCYDEIMLTDLSQRLQNLQRDTVIVFHQIGSHGPSYFERYPPQFELFKPACRSNRLRSCTHEEIANAYDNTIAYTDYVLSRQISLLREAADRVDSLMLYVSDHGESLGEKGIYLHGMPYVFAPQAQREVPMGMWVSEGYAGRTGLNVSCLRQRANDAFSHDNFYHTVLGAAQARNRLYDAGLDISSDCRGTAAREPSE